jgi:hypothetical protein
MLEINDFPAGISVYHLGGTGIANCEGMML